MKTDYSYCLNQDTCIHRRGCKRWVGNYPEEEVIELSNTGRDEYIDDKDCLPNYKDVNCEKSFDLLDRFRDSDGSDYS